MKIWIVYVYQQKDEQNTYLYVFHGIILISVIKKMQIYELSHFIAHVT